jgi:hypothetical protein
VPLGTDKLDGAQLRTAAKLLERENERLVRQVLEPSSSSPPPKAKAASNSTCWRGLSTSSRWAIKSYSVAPARSAALRNPPTRLLPPNSPLKSKGPRGEQPTPTWAPAHASRILARKQHSAANA